jgi:hypothetical protein
MNIEEYLRSHPMINPYSIDKVLGFPVGTVRLHGRPIPDKYREAIEVLLVDYGYYRTIEKPAEVLKTNSKYFTRKGRDGVCICYRDVIVRVAQDIPDNTPVYLG